LFYGDKCIFNTNKEKGAERGPESVTACFMMGKNPVYATLGRVALFLTIPRFIVIHTSGYKK
jgi:hypothetical protein